MQSQVVGLKELRENIEAYIAQIKKGKSFIVARRSRPVFKISGVSEDEGNAWERVADFSKIKKGGVPLRDLLSRL